MPINTVYPIKNKINLFFRDPIECLKMLMRTPLLADHIEFSPFHIFKTAEKAMRVYTEWLSGDAAWSMQVGFISQNATLSAHIFVGATAQGSNTLRNNFVVGQDKHNCTNRRSCCAPTPYQSGKYQERFSKQGFTPRLSPASAPPNPTFSASKQKNSRHS